MSAVARRCLGGLRAALAGLLIVALAGCTPVYRNHGYAPRDADLDRIAVGKDTRETVAETIGTPGTEGLLADSGWYYVQSRYEHYTYHAPKEIDRQVVAISFDRQGKVTNVERFGLEKGRVVALSRRVTDTGIRGISFLQQLFGSLGRLKGSDLLKE